MARGGRSNPTIRILVCGAPGVGKNCLESRFATGHWPPSYDSSLTLCSRRFYTIQHGPSAHSGQNDSDSASSSTPSSPESTKDPESPFSTATTQVASPSGSISPIIDEVDPSGPCKACLDKSQTYLIEIINYPRLSSTRHRQQVLAQGAYDAVLLVYSVGDRASYELIKQLHSEIPLRAQHKRRKSASWKNNRLSSLFTPTPANGKQPVITGDEAVCEGMGSGRAAVAIAGNMCDLDGEVALDKEQPRKDQVEDIEFANALSGLPLPHGDQVRSPSTPSTLSKSINSPQHRHRQVCNLSNRSSESLDEWVQVGKKNKSEVVNPDQGVTVAGENLSGARTAVNSERQVSHEEGEGLALELDTHVPFLETSAKTGENVEQLFEAIARAVLKKKGRAEVSREELAKRCQHRICTGNVEPRETELTVGIVAPRLDVPLFAPAAASVFVQLNGKNESSVQHAEVRDMGEEQVVGEAQRTDVQRPQFGRRSTILGRMKIFWKKESTLAEGLTV